MSLVASSLKWFNAGDEKLVMGQLAFDSSYPTGGETLNAVDLGLSFINRVIVEPKGYVFPVSYAASGTSANILVFQSASVTPAGTISAPAFTGSALAAHGHNVQLTQDEVIAVTAGTGVSAALTNIPVGSIDNVYIAAGGVTGAAVIVPVFSVANSKEVSINYTTGVLQFLVADAVTSAKVTYARAAVSTTSAGTPAGTNSAPTFTGTATTAAGFSQVPNTTNLSTLTGVNFVAFGY